MEYYKQWHNSKKIESINYTFLGESTAGMRTSFYVPELKVLLDAGHQCYNKVQDIFITHTHADHIASLPLMVLENVSDKIKTRIYCPNESKTFLINMIESFLACNYNNSFLPKKYYDIIGLTAGYSFELKLNNKDIIIEVFASVHTVPTLSYGFSEKKKKLKDEYIGKSSCELVSLKKEGIEITKNVIQKKFIFCGDTTINIFDNNNIYSYPNIIIECTYFDDDDIVQANNRRHMHWSNLSPVIKSNQDISFHLIHVSAKHRDIKDTVFNMDNMQFF